MPMSKLIICGCPRSGTTAITDLLNVNPDIYITKELSAFDYSLPVERIISRTDDTGIKHLIKKHGSPEFYDHLDYKIVGDKVPGYCLPFYHNHLTELDTKFIFCIRNCRSFIDSSIINHSKNTKERWVFDNYLEASQYWYNYTKSTIDFALSLSPNRYVFVKYEDAVLDIENKLREISTICNFAIELKNPFKEYYPVRVHAGKDIPSKEISPHALRLMELLGYQS